MGRIEPHLIHAMAEIIRGQMHPAGMVGVMLEDEIAAGYVPVYLGATEPFSIPLEDWEAVVLSITSEHRCRIVLVHARRKQSGAFSRLVNAISIAGYAPTVIEPIGDEMPAILRKWRWRGRRVGTGWNSYMEWSPP